MKKFLLLVFLFFLLTAVMLAAGEYAVRRIPNPYSVKREAISRFGKDTETVVLGSSHTYYGVVADSLDRTLNLANVSQTFEYDYRILNRYIDSLPRLKRVIIPISFFSFFDPLSTGLMNDTSRHTIRSISASTSIPPILRKPLSFLHSLPIPASSKA